MFSLNDCISPQKTGNGRVTAGHRMQVADTKGLMCLAGDESAFQRFALPAEERSLSLASARRQRDKCHLHPVSVLN
jgi:hypothetical protein